MNSDALKQRLAEHVLDDDRDLDLSGLNVSEVLLRVALCFTGDIVGFVESAKPEKAPLALDRWAYWFLSSLEYKNRELLARFKRMAGGNYPTRKEWALCKALYRLERAAIEYGRQKSAHANYITYLTDKEKTFWSLWASEGKTDKSRRVAVSTGNKVERAKKAMDSHTLIAALDLTKELGRILPAKSLKQKLIELCS